MEERLSGGGAAVVSEARAGELLADVRAGVATITLNRPGALNALSFGMIEEMPRLLDAWERDDAVRVVVLRGAGEKAFCAGGDIRMLHDSFRAGTEGYHDFFIREYALDHRIHRYPKPVVALVDGIVMGGGMGISQGAALRIVGDRTRMAMPETTIGLFPDVGGSYFLSRVPGKLGIYLGLAGPTMRAADALYCGLADIYLSPGSMARVDEWMAEAAASKDPRAAVKALASRDERGSLPPAELAALRPAIDRHFGAPTVEAIMASLASEAGEHREWAQRTLEALAKRSPTMLKVTLEQLQRGATMGLADCFRMELGLIYTCFEQGDFVEGIRALIVDKDNRPHWRPPAIDEVDQAAVARFFAPRWSPAQTHPLYHLR
ncbi:MAG TPA: enoyl-CoA hydratase/isomerase family protein [Usitatibacter sp.]|nr:enoyl-CoA hydratase/isomerase family protein [Usitatibacter sp.]